MKIVHYDKTNGKILGWYDKDIHASIPTPNIEVADDIWQEALNANANYVDVTAKTFSVEDFRTLEEIKIQKANEINTACGTQIISGFTSESLGSVKHYQSEQIDQLNLVGVVAGGIDDMFKCGTEDADFVNNGIIAWAYEPHTIAQLIQVLNDGKAYKQTLLQRAYTLKEDIESATTVAAVNAIVW